jgi:hypothetical protein
LSKMLIRGFSVVDVDVEDEIFKCSTGYWE